MTASPSAGSPIDAPWEEHPSPSASGVSASYRTGSRSWLGGRCYGVSACRWRGSCEVNVPHSPGLQISWSTREDGRRDGAAWLAPIHDALRDRGEVPVRIVSDVAPPSSNVDNVRGPIVNGNIVVRLVPYTLFCRFLPDLARFCEVDGGRVAGIRLGFGFFGGVCAVSGRDSPGGRGAKRSGQ